MLHGDRVLTILGMAVVTYLTRAICLVSFGTLTLPPWVERALRYVPVGVLSSLVFPQMISPGGKLALGVDNPLLWGALTSGLVARLLGGPFMAIVLGMIVVALVRQFTGLP